MPFGLTNSPAAWQRLIDRILGAELEPFVFVYMDDIIIVTQTFEHYLKILEEVLKRLLEANLTVSWEKCQLCRSEMKYLAYIVDKDGLHVDPDKVRAVLELSPPSNISEVRRILRSFLYPFHNVNLYGFWMATTCSLVRLLSIGNRRPLDYCQDLLGGSL